MSLLRVNVPYIKGLVDSRMMLVPVFLKKDQL